MNTPQKRPRILDAILLPSRDRLLPTFLADPNSCAKVCPDSRIPVRSRDFHCFCSDLLPIIALSGNTTNARATATNTTFTVIPIALLSFLRLPLMRNLNPIDKVPKPTPSAKSGDTAIYITLLFFPLSNY